MAQNSREIKGQLVCIANADGAAVTGDTLVADVDIEITGGDVDAGPGTDRDVATAGGALQSESADGGVGVSGGDSVKTVVTKSCVLGACGQGEKSIVTGPCILVRLAAGGRTCGLGVRCKNGQQRGGEKKRGEMADHRFHSMYVSIA